MFDHPAIHKYAFKEVPLDEDIFIVEEKWMEEYEGVLVGTLAGEKYKTVGYVSYAVARSISDLAIDLSWYPNIHDRFHEVRVLLPLDQFLTCIECRDFGEKPRVFVKRAWLDDLYLRPYSVFVMIDAIGVKDALAKGTLTDAKLLQLRHAIDGIATRHPTVAFVSFADTLLLKSNWYVGMVGTNVSYTYAPEAIIRLMPDIRDAYRNAIGLGIYATFVQGKNEYYDNAVLHISRAGNHICLNSLGMPFERLSAIDEAARSAIRNHAHVGFDLYMDEEFYHSLRFRFNFPKNDQPRNRYRSKMSNSFNYYFYNNLQAILDNLEDV